MDPTQLDQAAIAATVPALTTIATAAPPSMPTTAPAPATSEPVPAPALVAMPASAPDPTPAPIAPATPAAPVAAQAPVAEVAASAGTDAWLAVPITHNEPLLTFGSAGPDVRRLVTLLAAVGGQYATNAVIRGESPADVFDNSVMADVRRFQTDFAVAEDVESWQGHPVPAHEVAPNVVGPHTWHALHVLTGK